MKPRGNFLKTRLLLSLRAAISLPTNGNAVLNAKGSLRRNEANDLCPTAQMAPLCLQTTNSLQRKGRRAKVREKEKTTNTKTGSSKKEMQTKTKVILRSNSS